MSAARVEQVRRLLNPRNVVIVGASERAGSWAGMVRKNLLQFGYQGDIVAVNPRYESVWGQPCYPDVASLPEPPDHLVLVTPARTAAAVLEQGAAAGATSATVFASGFAEEGSAEGARYTAELQDVLARTGIALSGPNCLGNISAPARLVTLIDYRLIDVQDGPVAIVAQSGGVAMAINRRLTERGLFAGHVITSGNELGLTTADYLDYFVQRGGVRVVALFLEGLRDPQAFLSAVERARDAGVAVVALKIGGTARSRQAARAHTGALAGSLEAFDAVAGRSGLLRVDTIDELVEAIDALAASPRPAGPGVGAITLSGGARGLLEESAERRGVRFADVQPTTSATLGRLVGVGAGVGNPLDVGYAGVTSRAAYLAAVDALLADGGIDVLLAQGELPSAPDEGLHGDALLVEVDRRARDSGLPIVVFALANHNIGSAGRALRAALPHLGFAQGPDQAVAIAALLSRLAPAAEPVGTTDAQPAARVERARRSLQKRVGGGAWNEVDSKALLTEYGIDVPHEAVATSAQEAVAAAAVIGYPVTLKLILEDVGHKSEIGGVLLHRTNAAEVRAGFRELRRRAEQHGLEAAVGGVLVAEHVADGLELALGIHHDVEMGPVVMVGLGGVWLEVLRDVAFGPVPVSQREAGSLLDRTRAGRVLAGVRGGPAYDRDAACAGIVALGRLAQDCGDLIESVDVNPFLARPAGRGGLALDALVIPRTRAASDHPSAAP